MSNVHRAKLAHIDPEHRVFTQEITPGPGSYENTQITSKNNRATLAFFGPEHSQVTPVYTPGVGEYDVNDHALSSRTRVIYGKIDPDRPAQEIQVTVGPGEYNESVEGLSKYKR